MSPLPELINRGLRSARRVSFLQFPGTATADGGEKGVPNNTAKHTAPGQEQQHQRPDHLPAALPATEN